MRAVKKKKLWIYAVVTALLLVLVPGAAFAEPVDYAQATEFDTSTLAAQYAMLFDLDSGTVLTAKNTGMQVYPASTTKIMTCVLALENSDLSETVTLGEEIKQISGDSSTADLIVGEEMSMEDMLYGLMLSSGNDAANAIAVHVAGSIEAFVGMMNQKAAELGMNGTHYANAHGLHAEDHYTTLADMQLLLMHAYQNETFRTIVSTYEHTVAPTNKAPEGHVYKNSNRLLDASASNTYYQYATGVKTGFTDAAGHCLVATAEKDGLRLGALIYSSGDSARYADAAKLFFYGFESYELFDATALFVNQAPVTVQVADCDSGDVAAGTLSLVAVPDEDSPYMELSVNVKLIQSKLSEVELVLDPAEPTVTAPVAQGQEICAYRYVLGDKTLAHGKLVASRDVAARAPLFNWEGQNAQTRAGSLRWILYPLIGILALTLMILLIQSAFLRQSRRNKRRRAQTRVSGNSPLVMGDRYAGNRRKRR